MSVAEGTAGEARALRRRHVDLFRCRLFVGGRFSFGPTLDVCVAPTPDALVFTGRTREPLHHTSVRRSFDAACRRVAWLSLMVCWRRLGASDTADRASPLGTTLVR